MCLIVFAWQAHPSYPLVLAANRDEFLDRPTLQLDYWKDLPDVLGGRDVEKGGSWLATHVDGRWAAVTNFRDGGTASSPANLSRGHLVMNYVASGDQAKDYARHITQPLAEYAGCNLLVGDSDSLFFVSNRLQGERRAEAESVAAGVHGLSNHSLDTPWPKVQRVKRKLQQLIDDGSEDDELPSTGVPVEWERVLSPPFIVSESYGTRASTVVLMSKDGTVNVYERSFGAGGVELDRRAVTFRVDNIQAR
jgi:uncharacterized protein with NRDE domain